MRFALLLVAAVALASAPAAATIKPHSPVFTSADAATGITVQAGEDFFIALPSNASTGYSWTQVLPNDYVVAYEGNVREPAPRSIPGAPGQQLFIYHANRSGTATITLTLTRAFEPQAPPQKTLTYTVTVP